MKRVLLALLLLRSAGFAGTISEPYVGGYDLGIQLQPLGQTFTADAPNLVAATFWLQDYSYAPQSFFTYKLLAGAGTNGPVLASSAFHCRLCRLTGSPGPLWQRLIPCPSPLDNSTRC